jgi:phosphopantetheinyl transferase (holo-ACP synthase)
VTSAVGIDLVDLADAAAPSGRFVARVLAPAERALVEQAADPIGLIWRLWAAKESAYKVLAAADPELPFAHRRFRVDLAAGTVEHDGRTVPVRWQADGCGCVACCAGDGPSVIATATVDEAEALAVPLGARERVDGSRLSLAVRRLAKLVLRSLLGDEEVEIVRPARRGPPEVWRRGVRADGVSLSLSHDGRYVGCAVGLETPA